MVWTECYIVASKTTWTRHKTRCSFCITNTWTKVNKVKVKYVCMISRVYFLFYCKLSGIVRFLLLQLHILVFLERAIYSFYLGYVRMLCLYDLCNTTLGFTQQKTIPHQNECAGNLQGLQFAFFRLNIFCSIFVCIFWCFFGFRHVINIAC